MLSSCAQTDEQDSSAHRFVLTDSASSLRADSFSITSNDLATSGSWSVRKETLRGGKQDDVDLITIDNGEIVIRVIPTRGMSVLDVRKGDVRLGWDSPVKEVVHPKYVDLDTRGGLGWLDGFNEWMVRCGLEFAGHPGTDKFTTNTGDTAEMELSLHGKVGNIPASKVEVLIDKAPPHRIRVRGVVHERLFFGPKLELVAEVSTVPGSDSFRIDDSVTNRGGGDQEFTVIYHTNYGRPILEKGAKLIAPIRTIAPMNANAAKAMDTHATYREPTRGFVEEVFLIEPWADASGNTSILLQNAAADVGASMSWSTKEMPYLTVWKNTTAEVDGYVTGLEPGTGHPFNRSVERKFGRVPKLAPGATRSFGLEYGIHTTKESVAEFAKSVAGISAGRETTVEKDPPKID
jgi:hypothetical protein